jgi:hypothetical protein
MPFFKVRVGQQCGHNGKTLEAGTVIEISAHLGWECREKLEPCTKDGDGLGHLSPDELLIAQAAPHERDSLRALVGAGVATKASAAETKASTAGEGVAPSTHE